MRTTIRDSRTLHSGARVSGKESGDQIKRTLFVSIIIIIIISIIIVRRGDDTVLLYFLQGCFNVLNERLKRLRAVCTEGSAGAFTVVRKHGRAQT